MWPMTPGYIVEGRVIWAPEEPIMPPSLSPAPEAIEPRVRSAERFSGGLIVEFADGTAAIYTAAFLYSVLGQVERIIPGTDDW